jgi:serine/threonine protein kinase
LSGKSPFVCKNGFEVEDKILNVEISFPPGFDRKAKNLILKLLRSDPTKRLGAGKPGSSNDLEALKNHPFFRGKSFDKCLKRRPQVDSLEGGFHSEKYICKYEDIFSQTEIDCGQETAASTIKSIDCGQRRSSFRKPKTSAFAKDREAKKESGGFFKTMINSIKKNFQ